MRKALGSISSVSISQTDKSWRKREREREREREIEGWALESGQRPGGCALPESQPEVCHLRATDMRGPLIQARFLSATELFRPGALQLPGAPAERGREREREGERGREREREGGRGRGRQRGGEGGRGSEREPLNLLKRLPTLM